VRERQRGSEREAERWRGRETDKRRRQRDRSDENLKWCKIVMKKSISCILWSQSSKKGKNNRAKYESPD
jgi:hypothetical protein